MPSLLRVYSIFLFFITLLFFNQTNLFADEYHYNNMIIGERAAGMGGAFTAISNDSSGGYYNPAGLAFAKSKSLSLSVNAYNNSLKTYKDTLTKVNGGTSDWEQVSSRLLPNFFGIVHSFGPGKASFSYAISDSTLRDQRQTFNNIKANYVGGNISRFVININDVDNSYNLGPSYALKLNDSLSIGLTLYAHFRDNDIIRNQLLTFEDDAYEWINFYSSSTEIGYKPILGIMWLPSNKLSIGLTVSKTTVISSTQNKQIIHRGPIGITIWQDANTLAFSETEDEIKRKFPFSSTLGMAYKVLNSLLLSGDLTFFDKVDSSNKKSVFNFAFGAEYYPKASTALRMGLFTDLANTSKIYTAKTNQQEHIDIYGISLSVSHFSEASSFTIGGTFSIGDGEAQIIEDSQTIQDTTVRNITIFLSTGFI